MLDLLQQLKYTTFFFCQLSFHNICYKPETNFQEYATLQRVLHYKKYLHY